MGNVWKRLTGWIQGFAVAAPQGGATSPSPYTQHFILTMWVGAVLGVGALMLIAINVDGFPLGAQTVGASLLGMIASMSIGGLLGMLFGIPRIDYRDRSDPSIGPQIRQNDSLEQIADWLTKTIVGVTLVQSESAAARLKSLAAAFSVEIYGLPAGSYMAGLSTILAFGVMGFLLAYTWTRRYWVLEMKFILGSTTTERKLALEDAVGSITEATQRPATDAAPAQVLSARLALTRGWSTTPTMGAGDDPWLGKFGGTAVDYQGFRRLRIVFKRDVLTPVEGDVQASEWIQLQLIVESINPEHPLTGPVRFFLHPTFPNPVREVDPQGGTATLELRAWGGNFTIGAQTDGGRCQLEQHVGTCAPSWVPKVWRTK